MNKTKTKLNEDTFSEVLNSLLDANRFEDAQRLAEKKLQGKLDSFKLTMFMVYGDEEATPEELSVQKKEKLTVKKLSEDEEFKTDLQNLQEAFEKALPEGMELDSFRILPIEEVPDDMFKEVVISSLAEITKQLNFDEITLEEASELIWDVVSDVEIYLDADLGYGK